MKLFPSATQCCLDSERNFLTIFFFFFSIDVSLLKGFFKKSKSWTKLPQSMFILNSHQELVLHRAVYFINLAAVVWWVILNFVFLFYLSLEVVIMNLVWPINILVFIG